MDWFYIFTAAILIVYAFAMGWFYGGCHALEWKRKREVQEAKEAAERTILLAAKKVLGE